MGLRNLATAIGGIGFLLYTSPRLTALMLSVVPGVAIGAVLYGRSIRKLAKEAQDALAKSNEVAEEAISSVRTVRSFVGEEEEGVRYDNAVQRAYQLAVKRASAGSLFVGAATFASYEAAALVFWYGSRLVARHQLTVGGLSSFFFYTLLVAVSLGSLADLWADFMKSLGAAERIFEILDRTPTIPAGTGQEPSPAIVSFPESPPSPSRTSSSPTRPAPTSRCSRASCCSCARTKRWRWWGRRARASRRSRRS